VLTTLKHFRHEYEAHVQEGAARCRRAGARGSRWARTDDSRRCSSRQIVLTLFVFVMLLSSAAGMVYVERKVAALLQQRLGPYRVGPQVCCSRSPTSSS
jgi:hypothetical protein